MAVTRVSSITALTSCTDLGFLEWTIVLKTRPIVWCILSIKEFTCGFWEVVDVWVTPLFSHMSVNSCSNSGPLALSVAIFNGRGYLDSQPFLTAAAPS